MYAQLLREGKDLNGVKFAVYKRNTFTSEYALNWSKWFLNVTKQNLFHINAIILNFLFIKVLWKKYHGSKNFEMKNTA